MHKHGEMHACKWCLGADRDRGHSKQCKEHNKFSKTTGYFTGCACSWSWQSASVVGQQSPPFWRNCFHSCKASHRKHQCRKRACSTFSAVVALVFYPRKGCLCFCSIMPRRFHSDIREQHQDLVSQWPWLPDAFTVHGLVPSNPWRMLDIFFNK